MTQRRRSPLLSLTLCLSLCLALCLTMIAPRMAVAAPGQGLAKRQAEINAALLSSARAEVAMQMGKINDPEILDPPGGALPSPSPSGGLLLRAMHLALNMDLENEIATDKRLHPAAYEPETENAERPPDAADRIIWFRRHAHELTADIDAGNAGGAEPNWMGGDIVFFTRQSEPGIWMGGILSDNTDANGKPLIVIGVPPTGTDNEDALRGLQVKAHFRITPQTTDRALKPQSQTVSGGIHLRKPSWSDKPLSYPTSTVGWRAQGKLLAPAETEIAHGAAEIARRVVEGARAEVERGTRYDAAGYIRLDYPMGDVPQDVGVCTDLVVRAFRNAGFDLQEALHVDRLEHPEAYKNPRLLAAKGPDSNIDHRRCSNLILWFKRYAKELTTKIDPAHLDEWRGGDVVFFVYPDSRDPWHVAIVSDQRDPNDNLPHIIDLFPPTARESLYIDQIYEIGAHFRLTEMPPKLRQ